MLVIFVSPLCALASALFSARVVHHVLLVAAVAPLLAMAFPMRRMGSPPLAVLVATQAVVLWLWHAPGLYEWGLASVPAYWLMQASLLASAWLMWRAILAPAAQPGPALIALVATIGQMGLLGASDRLRASAALSGASREHGALGIEPARRPTARGAPDVGARDPALCRRWTLARLVQPAARPSPPRDDVRQVCPHRHDRDLGGRAHRPAVSVLAAPAPRGRARARPAAPGHSVRLRGVDLTRRVRRDRQRNGSDLPAKHVPRVVHAQDAPRRNDGDAACRRRAGGGARLRAWRPVRVAVVRCVDRSLSRPDRRHPLGRARQARHRLRAARPGPVRARRPRDAGCVRSSA